MKLTNKQVLELGAALAQLSQNGMRYEQKITYYLGRCIRKLQPALESLEAARLELNITLQSEPDKDVQRKAHSDWATLGKEECDVDLEPRLRMEDLRLFDPNTDKGNLINPSIIASIGPLMVQEPD